MIKESFEDRKKEESLKTYAEQPYVPPSFSGAAARPETMEDLIGRRGGPDLQSKSKSSLMNWISQRGTDDRSV